ncbi:MAG: heterodisulfide reductase subunit B [Desulfitibacter sp. BRH_c19]|nr:MAG: heterodisulfide reductase subunit B [Desulfitibacter sp. BRH_c19]
MTLKYAYYPGCSLNSTGVEYNQSAKAVAKHLGVQLEEIDDWNCCGASAAHNTSHLLSIALPARSLALSEKQGLDVAVPCAACFNRMKAAQVEVRESKEMKQTISEVIGMEYEAKYEVKPLLDVLVNDVGLDKIKEAVTRPLTGLKVASYYGCLLVRPPKTMCFDDVEDPMTMDNLVEALGGEPVDWSYKVECCGAGHSTAKPSVGIPMIRDILKNAKLNGANCILTACPLCFLNLDMRQKEASQLHNETYELPVFYFTQLMGLAIGYSAKELFINKHFVDPMKLLEEKDIFRHPDTRREKA